MDIINVTMFRGKQGLLLHDKRRRRTTEEGPCPKRLRFFVCDFSQHDTFTHFNAISFYFYVLLNVDLSVTHQPWIKISFVSVHPTHLLLHACCVTQFLE